MPSERRSSKSVSMRRSLSRLLVVALLSWVPPTSAAEADQIVVRVGSTTVTVRELERRRVVARPHRLQPLRRTVQPEDALQRGLLLRHRVRPLLAVEDRDREPLPQRARSAVVELA